MKQLVIIGASGHGKVVADIARLSKYDDICFLDDNEELACCNGYPVVGKSTDYVNLNCDFVIAIGNNSTRKKLQELLESSGKSVVALIHPNAVVGDNAVIGAGTVVMAGAVINAAVKIGKGCIINTCSSVDHGCILGDYVHLSVGDHMAGACPIADGTWIGAGATIINNIDISSDCMIGAGAVVIKNISQSGTYVGVPVKKIK